MTALVAGCAVLAAQVFLIQKVPLLSVGPLLPDCRRAGHRMPPMTATVPFPVKPGCARAGQVV